MKKSLLLGVGALLAVSALAGCNSTSSSTVELTVWGGELQTSQDWLTKMGTNFAAANPGTTFKFNIGAVSESKVKDEWTKDPQNAADVAIAADDQLYDLAKAGDLQKISDIDSSIASDVLSRNSTVSGSVCKYNDELYAFPVSASNGYFLYYDSSKIAKSQTDTFEHLLAAIKAASTKDGKTYKFGFPQDSGWYLEGWFRAAGFSIDKDSNGKNNCAWNSTTTSPTGVEAASALVQLSQGQYKDYWLGDSDSNLMTNTVSTASNQVIATINGTWSADTISTNYGTGAAATVLPSYAIGSKSYAMQAVAGHKIAIVNAFSKQSTWAVKFANYITNEANQIDRYDTLKEAPSNTAASTKVDLTKNYAVAALSQQVASAGFVQNVGGNFWTASGSLDKALNTGADGDTSFITSGAGTSSLVINTVNLQTSLDTAVAAINADPS